MFERNGRNECITHLHAVRQRVIMNCKHGKVRDSGVDRKNLSHAQHQPLLYACQQLNATEPLTCINAATDEQRGMQAGMSVREFQ
jgi:hypothetical protein